MARPRRALAARPALTLPAEAGASSSSLPRAASAPSSCRSLRPARSALRRVHLCAARTSRTSAAWPAPKAGARTAASRKANRRRACLEPWICRVSSRGSSEGTVSAPAFSGGTSGWTRTHSPSSKIHSFPRRLFVRFLGLVSFSSSKTKKGPLDCTAPSGVRRCTSSPCQLRREPPASGAAGSLPLSGQPRARTSCRAVLLQAAWGRHSGRRCLPAAPAPPAANESAASEARAAAPNVSSAGAARAREGHAPRQRRANLAPHVPRDMPEAAQAPLRAAAASKLKPKWLEPE
mmetsp:Transcript_106907/g.297715  ORF Transcript_106907/g.297715 Transcript_106907/m.297715 type:complete len:291 (+) Transcript_106907:374-1246(+)